MRNTLDRDASTPPRHVTRPMNGPIATISLCSRNIINKTAVTMDKVRVRSETKIRVLLLSELFQTDLILRIWQSKKHQGN